MILCSCVCSKQVRNQSLEVVKFDIAKLNGTYESQSDTTFTVGLFSILNPDFPFSKGKKYPSKQAKINFKFDGRKTLTVTTIDNNDILSEVKLKGSIKGNYFSVRKKLHIIPFPFIIYTYAENKILLGNDKNGNLIVKNGYYSIAWIFLMSAGNSYTSQSQFKKIN